MNTAKIWQKPLSEIGWVWDGRLFRRFGDKLFYSMIPDLVSGIIPTEFNQPLSLHDELREFSTNIYIGDLNDTWHHPDYKSLEMEYQVIGQKGLRLEKDTRNQISQAKRNGLQLKPLTKDYYDCILSTALRQNRPPLSPWILKVMLENFQSIGAWKDDKLIAGCIWIDEGDKIRYLHNASLVEYLHLRPNHLLLNHIVEQGKDIFMGIAPKHLESLAKFKGTFGAKIRTFKIKYYEA